MNTHLRTFHKDIKFLTKNDKNKENTVTPITIKNALLSKNAYDIESDKYKHITDHVVNFIAETNQPLSVVDHPAFIKLLSKLDDKYKLPGRLTITTKYLKEKVNKVKSLIKKELEESEFVSVTLDGWSSISSDAYLGIYIFCG